MWNQDQRNEMSNAIFPKLSVLFRTRLNFQRDFVFELLMQFHIADDMKKMKKKNEINKAKINKWKKNKHRHPWVIECLEKILVFGVVLGI